MCKYNPLWEAVKKDKRISFDLSFDEIKEIIGSPIDHSFFKSKDELLNFGYCVTEISLTKKIVTFSKLKETTKVKSKEKSIESNKKSSKEKRKKQKTKE